MICKEVYIYCDVLEKVIVVVVFLKMIDIKGGVYVGYIMGKVKVVFLYGYSILRLELCVVVLVVQIFEIIFNEFDFERNLFYFFSDS